MNRSRWTHGSWLLITIGTFVAGSQWAGLSKSGDEWEMVGRRDERPPAETRKSTPHGWVAPSRELTSNAPSRKSSKGLERSNRSGSQEGSNAWTKTRGNLIPSAIPSNEAPLNNDQMRSLVLQAIKSFNPVKRRQAFDRLLEEMQSGTFTNEQAMTIRKAMAENGASGEQWKNFDYAWGANEPEAALAHIDEIPQQYLNGFLYNMIPGLASADPQAAIDLFGGLGVEVQNKIRNRLFEGLIDNDVAVATNYIYDVTNLEDYNWRPMDVLTREIVVDVGVSDTLAWAAELPEGPLRGSAWSAAYAHWGQRQPEVAVQSIIEMSPSQDRNLAINGFTAAYAHQDGATAVAWAAEITESGLRQAALVRAATQYYRQDQQAATEWFGSSGMSPESWAQATGIPVSNLSDNRESETQTEDD